MGRTHSTCRHCGFGVPADSPVCPGCQRPAIADWRKRSRHYASARRKARKGAATPLRDTGYRSLLFRAETSRFLLTVTTIVGVVAASLYAVWTFRVDDPTVTVDGSTVEIDQVTRFVTFTLLGMLAVTGVAFVAWAVRAYRNLPALGINERRYWTIWLVIGWIIPGANLLVPKLLVDDIWRASSPSVEIGGGDSWQRRPVASTVNRWWCSFLVTPAIAVLAAITARGGVAEYEERVAAAALAALAALSIVIAATAARGLIAVVTVAQARRADVIIDLRDDQRAVLASQQAMKASLR